MKTSIISKLVIGLLVISIAGVLVAPARAVTISSSVNGIVFQDDFENDTLGAFPTLSGGDVGLGYTMLGSDLANSDVEDDSTATGPLQESRLGKYLNIRHVDDAAANGKVTLDFGSESGSTLTASFFANITEGGVGNSLRVSFKNGATYINGPHTYLVTGQFLITQAGIGLPAGVTADDVVVAYHNGSWQVATTGGGAMAALVDGGAGKWIDVSVSQGASIGSQAIFTLNGTALDPILIGSSQSAIDRFEFSTNGGAGQSYIDGVAPVPEPMSICIFGLGIMGMALGSYCQKIRCER